MMNLLRLINAEFVKMRHTVLFWLHIVVPVAGAAVFLMYYQYAPWEPPGKVEGYIQALAIAFPFLTAMICSMAVELEEEGHMQTFFTMTNKRWHALTGKLLTLLLAGLAATAAAVLIFAGGFELIIEHNPISWQTYVELTILLFAGQILIYEFHLFLSFQFGKGASIGAGVAESVLAALMLTGLGRGIWQYLPAAWSGSWCNYLLIYKAGNKEAWNIVSEAIPRELLACAAAALLAQAALFVWFHYYEGRRCLE